MRQLIRVEFQGEPAPETIRAREGYPALSTVRIVEDPRRIPSVLQVGIANGTAKTPGMTDPRRTRRLALCPVGAGRVSATNIAS